MTTRSAKAPMPARDLRAYGFARARDAAYDAVQTLWRRRKSEGWHQTDIAEALERDTAWVSRNLRGPGNWTMKTFGEFVEALKGEAEINVHALEDPVQGGANFDAYDGYGIPPLTIPAPTDSDRSRIGMNKTIVRGANLEFVE